MALNIGNNAVANAFVGSSQVRRAYKGGTLVYQGFGPASEQEFIQQEATGGPAQLLKVYGKSVVNNQLAGAGRTSNGVTAALTNGVYELTGTISTTFSACIGPSSRKLIAGHKYLLQRRIAANPNNLSFYVKLLNQQTPSSWDDVIVTAADAGGTLGISNATNGTDFTGVKIEVSLIDLTLRFGAGNEPTSVDEALRLLGGDAFDPTYDPGSLQSNKTSLLRAERIPVINVWDEEWVFGRYDTNTGEPTENAMMLRNKNRISILPNSTYYVAQPGGSGLYLYIYFYDLEGNFIGKIEGITPNRTFTPTAEAAFMNFFYYKAGGLTTMPATSFYFSNSAINGQYFPHWRGSLSLNLSTLTGKLNGEGASVVVFPNGMCRVGDIRDEAEGSTVVKKVVVLNLGDLTWNYGGGVFYTSVLSDLIISTPSVVSPIICGKYEATKDNSLASGPDKMISMNINPRIRIKDSSYTDATLFKVSLAGVMAAVPLATPLTYTLDTPLPTDLTCEQGDILQRVSDNNCPFVGEMRFGL